MKYFNTFLRLFLIFSILFSNLLNISFVKADEIDDIKIISRSEWWANEEYRFADSTYWKPTFEAYEKNKDKPKTRAQIKADAKNKVINDYLMINYLDDNIIWDRIEEENGRKLTWPIEKSQKIRSIVIHHTDTKNTTDSYKAIKDIYKYHALSNWWWDIWYNYLIWFNWEIFEWRAWWDYAVWAHAFMNNRQTIWISVIWDYQNNNLNSAQKESILKLTKYVAKKYWIDTNINTNHHKSCNTCKTYVSSSKTKAIIWHRDAWITTCPWKYLYTFIDQVSSELNSYSKWFTKILFNKTDSNIDNNQWTIDIKDDTFVDNWPSYDENNYIKIKLSYPIKDSAIITYKWKDIKFVKEWTKLRIQNKYLVPSVTLKNNDNEFTTIKSWDRKPSWDKTGKINDNIFRWNIIVYVEWDKLVLVNEIKINDYLKWLWEVGNDAPEQKAKTIITAARTYARWYTKPENRKFPWKSYDWSDNPDEFQKYLGYSLEKRTPNIARYVDETKDQVITYNNTIIKPWYFNSSVWYTKSFSEYCLSNWWTTEKCDNSKYPYLVSVEDPGSSNTNYSWNY